jgi:hypothetical protein
MHEQRSLEGATVDGIAKGILHRHCLGWNHVDAPQLGAVETALPRRLIDQPLDDVDRLGEAGPAGDPDRRSVGQHGGDPKLDCRDPIHRPRQVDVLERLHTPSTHEIGADIRCARDAQCHKAAIGVERERRLRLMVARLVVGEEAFAASGNPFDWAADALRCPRHQDMLGIDEILGSEATANIRRDQPHRRGRYPQGAGGVVARRMDALARHIGRIPAALRIPHADDAARLHRVGDDPVIVEIELDSMRRRCECRIDGGSSAGAPIEAEIAGCFFCNLPRAGGARGSGGRGGGQWRVVDRHLLCGIEGLGQSLGDDKRNRLTDIADLVSGQYRLQRERERFASLRVRFRRRAQRLQPVGPRVFSRHRREHARSRPRFPHVDAFDPRMRMRRAQHHRMYQTLENEIVEILAAASQETQILPALGPVADHRPSRHYCLSDRI